jgi:hypothetical protein
LPFAGSLTQCLQADALLPWQALQGPRFFFPDPPQLEQVFLEATVPEPSHDRHFGVKQPVPEHLTQGI